MNLPETLTPWLVLFVTFLGALAAAGGAWMWIWRKVLWPAFEAGVMDAVAPLQESLNRLSVAIEHTEERLATNLAERTAVVDKRFDEIVSAHATTNSTIVARLAMLEVRQARGVQTVVDAVQVVQDSLPTPESGQ